MLPRALKKKKRKKYKVKVQLDREAQVFTQGLPFSKAPWWKPCLSSPEPQQAWHFLRLNPLIQGFWLSSPK